MDWGWLGFLYYPRLGVNKGKIIMFDDSINFSVLLDKFYFLKQKKL